VWELLTSGGSLANSVIAHYDAILQLAWSPDSKVLGSTAAERSLKAFNAAVHTEIKTYPHQSDWILSLQFAPDGKKFAAGRYDGSLAFFETPVPGAKIATR